MRRCCRCVCHGEISRSLSTCSICSSMQQYHPASWGSGSTSGPRVCLSYFPVLSQYCGIGVSALGTLNGERLPYFVLPKVPATSPRIFSSLVILDLELSEMNHASLSSESLLNTCNFEARSYAFKKATNQTILKVCKHSLKSWLHPGILRGIAEPQPLSRVLKSKEKKRRKK